jgi:hypothetical protein
MGGARGKVVLFVLGIWNNALSAPSSMTGISAPLTFSRSLGRSSTDISLPRARHDFHVFQRQTTAEQFSRFVEHHHASREGTRVHDPRRYAHAKSMIDAVTGLQPSPLDGECSSETQATPKQKPGEKSAKTPRIENE